ncbi:MAG TPA: hypothetical protein VIE16_03620 [Phenylobacterium sp.]
MARLSGAFAKLGRAVRQSVALHARLESDRRRGEAQVENEAARARIQALEHRKGRVRRGVDRVLESEWEAPDYEPDEDDEDDVGLVFPWAALAYDRVEDLSAAQDFLNRDPDELIAALCEELRAALPPLSRPSAAAPAPPRAHPDTS